MFSYYGAKTNIVDHYPPPVFGKIIEPFAGTARYSLKYFDKEVVLVDPYEDLIRIWKWLQRCAPSDILSLPTSLKPGTVIADLGLGCKEAEDLLGFLVGYGNERPRRTPSKNRTLRRPNHLTFSLGRIAGDLHKIKHWDIRVGTYDLLKNEKATWFIDPPYREGGHKYVHNSSGIDYKILGDWCRGRKGQAIVCEKSSADWLSFCELVKHQGAQGPQNEGVWCSPASIQQQQLKLF